MALTLAQCLLRVAKDGHAFDGGDPPPTHPPYDPARRPISDMHDLIERLADRLQPEVDGT